ncbi:hypothetical protein TD95_000878 [Thielaviopsis punctulata]|uniref:Nuclear protein localization protein 4 n=1 Tax=Thielaviopsis punctulata TaxID=72032 RepID=A0A0F4ZA65_9PEZI|nr:hypothetical protein TD95_000878 [Thielaviopsis punctulata]
MLLRARGPDGTFRLTLEPSNTFNDLAVQLVPLLPDTVDPLTISLSNSPTGTDSKLLHQIAQFQISQVGMKHGDLIFLSYKHKSAESSGTTATETISQQPGPVTARLNGKPIKAEALPSAAETVAIAEGAARPWELVKQSPLDEYLDKQPGTIPRSRNSMCRHGPKGMCDYCTPLEPFNPTYLAENGIKYPSFHAHLRKINAATNKPESGTSFIPPLTEPFYRVAADCSGGHPKWPVGICSKCQPSAIILQPQNFRMVDHVEFASPQIIDNFINTWRRTGSQRLGFLFGRYAEYVKVPLGIKAVVEAVYEPPQVDQVDGLTVKPWEDEAEVKKVAQMCGLEVVGVIWTDLMDAGKGDGSVVCKRHADSYFLSSQEICFASRLQAQNPRVTKWSRTGVFGSNFVTCVISGNERGEIEISSYQMSNSAVEMVRADIIEPSTEPAVMMVQEEEDESTTRSRYIPEVFYRRINEYGANVQENAKPSFPVEYLFVTLTHGFPDVPKPMFTEFTFPIENREYLGICQDHSNVARVLKGSNGKGLSANGHEISNFHLLCYLHKLNILSEASLFTEYESLLCKAGSTHGPTDINSLCKSNGWLSLLTIVQSSGERIPKRPRPPSMSMSQQGGGSSYSGHKFPSSSSTTEKPGSSYMSSSSASSLEVPTPSAPHIASASASASIPNAAATVTNDRRLRDEQPLAKRFAAVRLNNENRPQPWYPPPPPPPE